MSGGQLSDPEAAVEPVVWQLVSNALTCGAAAQTPTAANSAFQTVDFHYSLSYQPVCCGQNAFASVALQKSVCVCGTHDKAHSSRG